jgi:hypothetical protein
MAAFNFPVDSAILRQRIHPALSLDLDGNKQAWVSILSSSLVKTAIDGVPIPFIKPFEIQVRTYVTGPDPKTKGTIKGVWLFDMLLSSAPVVLGADVLFAKSIRIASGNINVIANQSLYNLAGLDLEVANKDKAGVSARATIMPSAASTTGEWFLNRTAWFGQNQAGDLTVSMIHGQKHFSNVTQMHVSDFSSTVFKALHLGDDFGKEVFARHPEGAFLVGGMEATWSNSIIVSPTSQAIETLV